MSYKFLLLSPHLHDNIYNFVLTSKVESTSWPTPTSLTKDVAVNIFGFVPIWGRYLILRQFFLHFYAFATEMDSLGEGVNTETP